MDATDGNAATIVELEEELERLRNERGGEQSTDTTELQDRISDLEKQLEQAQGQEQDQEKAELQQELSRVRADLRQQQLQVQVFEAQTQELEARKKRLEVVIQQMRREQLEREQGSDQRCMEELLDASSALNSALGKVTQRVERHEAASNGGEVDGCVVGLYELQNDLITAIYNVARTRGAVAGEPSDDHRRKLARLRSELERMKQDQAQRGSGSLEDEECLLNLYEAQNSLLEATQSLHRHHQANPPADAEIVQLIGNLREMIKNEPTASNPRERLKQVKL